MTGASFMKSFGNIFLKIFGSAPIALFVIGIDAGYIGYSSALVIIAGLGVCGIIGLALS
jgi:hypothetical protein